MYAKRIFVKAQKYKFAESRTPLAADQNYSLLLYFSFFNMYVFFRGEWVDENNAALTISDPSIHPRYLVFDFFRVRDGVLVYVEPHLERFFHSARILPLPVPHSKEELRRILLELPEKNGVTEAGVKMILTGGYSPDGYEIANPNLIIITKAKKAPKAKPMQFITHEYVRDFPEAKTIK